MADGEFPSGQARGQQPGRRPDRAVSLDAVAGLADPPGDSAVRGLDGGRGRDDEQALPTGSRQVIGGQGVRRDEGKQRIPVDVPEFAARRLDVHMELSTTARMDRTGDQQLYGGAR